MNIAVPLMLVMLVVLVSMSVGYAIGYNNHKEKDFNEFWQWYQNPNSK